MKKSKHPPEGHGEDGCGEEFDWLTWYIEKRDHKIRQYEDIDDQLENDEARYGSRSYAKYASLISAKKQFRKRQIREQLQHEKPKRLIERVIGFASLEELHEYERHLAKSYHKLLDARPEPIGLIKALDFLSTRLLDYLRQNPHEIYRLPPRRFEELVAEILASFNWRVHLTQPTRDGGYDIFAISCDISGFESSWVVECKRYGPDKPVGISVVRELYAVKSDLRAANAIVATTSRFTDVVREYKSSRYDLQLRDFQGVVEWINDYRPRPDGRMHIENNRLKFEPKP